MSWCRRALATVALGLVLGPAPLALGSCSPTVLPISTPPKQCDLQIVTLSVLSSRQINRSPEGQARPVQVRIYQLKTDVRLENASFEQIWKQDKATLQDDLVKVDEVPIYPDSRTEVKFERDESAQYVAAVALFRNPKGKSWLTSYELPPAPGKGQCGVPQCNGKDCPQGPVLRPQFILWLDEMRIEDGEEHADEHPEPGKVIHISGKKAPEQGAAPTGTAPASTAPAGEGAKQ